MPSAIPTWRATNHAISCISKYNSSPNPWPTFPWIERNGAPIYGLNIYRLSMYVVVWMEGRGATLSIGASLNVCGLRDVVLRTLTGSADNCSDLN